MKVFLSLCLALLLAVPFSVQASPPVGELAPEFTAVDSNGVSHNLSDFRGKIVVLEWTNHECPFVIKHYDTNNMQALQKAHTDNDGIWLRIVSSAEGKQGFVTGEQANQIAQDQNAAATATLLDASGDVGRLYEAKTTPHMYVIDAEGVLRYAGAIDDNDSMRQSTVEGATNYVQAAIDSLRAGQDVQVAMTQPYGCSIKY